MTIQGKQCFEKLWIWYGSCGFILKAGLQIHRRAPQSLTKKKKIDWSDTHGTMLAWPHIPVWFQTHSCCLESDGSWMLCDDLEWLWEISCHEGFPTRLVSLMPDPLAAKSFRARGLTPPQRPLTSSGPQEARRCKCRTVSTGWTYN